MTTSTVEVGQFPGQHFGQRLCAFTFIDLQISICAVIRNKGLNQLSTKYALSCSSSETKSGTGSSIRLLKDETMAKGRRTFFISG